MENYLKAKYDDDHETLKKLKIKPIKEKSKSEQNFPLGLNQTPNFPSKTEHELGA